MTVPAITEADLQSFIDHSLAPEKNSKSINISITIWAPPNVWAPMNVRPKLFVERWIPS